MSRRHPGAWACLAALLLAVSSCVGSVHAAPAAPAACPPLLTLVELLPESTIFTEILMALGAEGGSLLVAGLCPCAAVGDGRQLCLWLPCRTLQNHPCLSLRSQTVSGHRLRRYPGPSTILRTLADVPARPTAQAAARGRRLAEPAACPANFAPVCGVDNTTYSNACMAAAQGVKVACKGECPCATPCPTNYLPVCGVGEWGCATAGCGDCPLSCRPPHRLSRWSASWYRQPCCL